MEEENKIPADIVLQVPSVLEQRSNLVIDEDNNNHARRLELFPEEDARGREMYRQQKIKYLAYDTLIRVFSISVMLLLLLLKGDKKDSDMCSKGTFREWITVSICVLSAGVVTTITQYCYFRKSKMPPPSCSCLGFFLRGFFIGWSIYGNVILFKTHSDCFVIRDSLGLAVFMGLVDGYWEFFKVGLFLFVLCCYMPLYICFVYFRG